MKKISIILCTYNGEAYLQAQIDSLLGQTYPFYELIVQDDNSTDNTIELLENYRKQFPERNIRLYVNPQRLGYNRNFLTAATRATGDYIACCDQDDVWMDNKLEALMQAIGNSPLIFHDSILTCNGQQTGRMHRQAFPASFPPLSAVLYPRSYGHQILFRKDVLERLKAFTAYEVSYDYLIFAIAGSLAPVRYLHVPLVYWRRHEEAVTYRPQQVKSGKWKGYADALRALATKDNRRRTRQYFSLLRQVSFCQPTAGQAVCYMSRGSLAGILCTCLLCLRHSREAVPEAQGFTRLLRAFFLPMFFVRDHGRYIISLPATGSVTTNQRHNG